MKVLILFCLFGATVALNEQQLRGLKRLLKKLDAGVFPTCNLVFFSDMVNFDTAEQKCKDFSLGTAQVGNLATVNDEGKNKDLKILLEMAYPLQGDKEKWGPDKWVWAGLRKTLNNLGEEGSQDYDPVDWSWSDGTHPQTFENWFSDKQPDQNQKKMGEDGCDESPRCLQNQMRINHAGEWDDTYKYKLHPYACDYQGKYILSATRKSWTQAKKACENAGLHLAMVKTEGDLDEILAAARYFLGERLPGSADFYKRNWFWLGGNDIEVEGVWTWDYDKSAMDRSWMPFRHPNPDDAQKIGETGQDALALSLWGKFDDSYIHKTRKRPFACQCPGSPPSDELPPAEEAPPAEEDAPPAED